MGAVEAMEAMMAIEAMVTTCFAGFQQTASTFL